MVIPWARKPQFFCKSGDTYKPSKQMWRRERRRHWLKMYMSHHGCAKCGTKDPRVLTFDHIDPKQKSFSILKTGESPILNKVKGYKLLKEEVGKCQILCQNCHKIKTDEENDASNRLHCGDKREAAFIEYHGDD